MSPSSTHPLSLAGSGKAALTDLLGKIESGNSCTPSQVDNLVVNRTGGECRHRAMRYLRRHDLVREMARERPAKTRLVLEECAEACGPCDFDLLVHLARGLSPVELAETPGVNQNALKVRAHRVRQKIRHALN